MLSRLRSRHRLLTPALCLLLSLAVGRLVGFGVFNSGTHDLSQIVEISLLMAESGTLAGIFEIPPRTSPGRHLPYVLLFALTGPESMAAAQAQGERLTWLIGFGAVPMAAYAAGEALSEGYGPYVAAVDVGLRVLPWSRYTDAQPQYTLAAGCGLLCLAIVFRDDLEPTIRGVGIGATAAAAVWVTPVAGVLVTVIATAALVSERQFRGLAAAAGAGFVVCLPLLLVEGGSSRAILKLLWALGVFPLIHPEADFVVAWLKMPSVLLTGLVSLLAAWVSDREIVVAMGALTVVLAFATSGGYLPRMALPLFVPLLTVAAVARLRDIRWQPETHAGRVTSDSDSSECRS